MNQVLNLLRDFFSIPFAREINDYRLSWKPTDKIIQYLNQKDIKVNLAYNFIPERYSKERNLQILKFITTQLKIKDVRLGIRWNNVEVNENQFNINYYKPYLDFFKENNIRLVLNIGPIKTIAWPEEQIPHFYSNLCSLNQNLKCEDEVVIKSLNYLKAVLVLLEKEYNVSSNELFYAIQPDNEGFNPFGILKTVNTQEYLREVISIISQHFPSKKIYLNSAGRLNFRQLFTALEFTPNKKYIFSLNFYYSFPFRIHSIFAPFDGLNTAYPSDLSVRTIQKRAQNQSIELEVGEAQCEPWGREQRPGNSLQSFKFVVLRTARLYNLENRNVKIRLWGLDYMVNNFLESQNLAETEKIFEVIKLINSNVVD